MQYRIKAVDARGALAVYEIDAVDELDARRQAEERGGGVVAIATKSGAWMRRRGGRIPLITFSQELVSLLDAGLPLVEALETLSENEEHPGERRIILQLLERLYEGRTLAAALSEHPRIFPSIYVATVRASERTSALPDALRRFIAYQQQVDSLKKALINASIYPAIVTAAGVLVTLFLLVYVVPRFSAIYEDLGRDLPFASRMLMGWGRFLDAHAGAAVMLAVALAAGLVYASMQDKVRAAVGRLLVRLPTLGKHIFLYQLSRFYRTVGILLRGGMPAVAALDMAGGLLGADLRGRLMHALQSVREGQTMSHALSRAQLTTPVAMRMLRVGETGGNMGEMTERIAAFYDEQLTRWIVVLTRVLDPILMSVIGVMIGAIVVLLYFPIFELASSVQ